VRTVNRASYATLTLPACPRLYPTVPIRPIANLLRVLWSPPSPCVHHDSNPFRDLNRQAGPSHNMNWYYPGGNATRHAGPRGTDPNAMNGNAVMYDAVNGKVLTLGGAPNYGVRARWIDA